MNGGNCQNCQNSPWVKRANKFISSTQNPVYQVETVKFLLQNGYCGLDNRTHIDSILNYLSSKGITLSREEFQNQVLTELKREGIVATLVYPGPQGGVFIPCSEDEIKKAAMQVFDRIIQELTNLKGVVKKTSIYDLVSKARKEMEILRGKIR